MLCIVFDRCVKKKPGLFAACKYSPLTRMLVVLVVVTVVKELSIMILKLMDQMVIYRVFCCILFCCH